MDKPITVARQEFIENLVNIVNNSGLPAFVMRNAFIQMNDTLQQLEQSQLEKDMAEWKSQIGEVKDGAEY